LHASRFRLSSGCLEDLFLWAFSSFYPLEAPAHARGFLLLVVTRRGTVVKVGERLRGPFAD